MVSTLVITDPAAVRSMSVPSRFLAVDELYTTQRPRTATELAMVSGASPSGMSYHLRELERLGIIRRAVGQADGRARPWEACAESYVIQASDDGDGRDRVLLLEAHLKPMQQRMLSVLSKRAQRPAAQRNDDPYRVLVMDTMLLTETEVSDLGAKIDQILDDYAALSRQREDSPEGFIRTAHMWSMVPQDTHSTQ